MFTHLKNFTITHQNNINISFFRGESKELQNSRWNKKKKLILYNFYPSKIFYVPIVVQMKTN